MKRILLAFLLTVCAGGAAFATNSGGSCVVKNGQGSAAYVNFDCEEVYVGLDYATGHDVVVLVEVSLQDGQSTTISVTIPATRTAARTKVNGAHANHYGSANCIVSARIASASCL